MRKADDPDRFHRIVGWLSAIAFFFLVGVPIFVVGVVGECIPDNAACLSGKRDQVVGMLFGVPVATALAGWLMFRLSKFFDGPRRD